MEALVNYFTDTLGFSGETVHEKMDLFNEIIQDPSRNRFSFLIHLNDTLGESTFDNLIKKEPSIVRNAEKEYTKKMLLRLYPQLTEDELQKIVIKKQISPKELQLIAKLESQLAGIELQDLIFLDMLGDGHQALSQMPNLYEYGQNVSRKFLMFETKCFDSDELDSLIAEKKIDLGEYIVKLANNRHRTIPLRFINWDAFKPI